MNYKAIALILSASSLLYLFRRKKKALPEKKSKFKTSYVKNEMIVLFKDLGEERSSECKKYQSKVFAELIQAGCEQKSACGNCDGLLSLWTCYDPEAVLGAVGQSQPSGSVSVVKSGEEDIAYLQLNFITELPLENQRHIWDGLKLEGKEKEKGPIIAVLDTGIDTEIFPTQYLWNYEGSAEDPCYEKHEYGHDFVNNASVKDDDAGRHGTLINAYILEQFKDSETYPKLMNIKVLDSKGHGTYYDFICGILFAKSHGAQIINASLGYYDYDHGSTSNLDLDYLLNRVLKENGILFVSAAGNQTNDTLFLNDNPTGNPRDLEQHPFNFASINDASEKSPTNIIAVTTIDVKDAGVSPTQNHSSKYVDLGVQADEIEKVKYGFKLPFPELNPEGHIMGSSFATAIATGRIAATLPKAYYSNRKFKHDIIEPIRMHSGLKHENNGLQQFVYRGSYINR